MAQRCILKTRAQMDGAIRDPGYVFILPTGIRGPHRTTRAVHDRIINTADYEHVDADLGEDMPLYDVLEEIPDVVNPSIDHQIRVKQAQLDEAKRNQVLKKKIEDEGGGEEARKLATELKELKDKRRELLRDPPQPVDEAKLARPGETEAETQKRIHADDGVAEGKSFKISAISWEGGLVTVETEKEIPSLMTGDEVIVENMTPAAYDGVHDVKNVVDDRRFTYLRTYDPGESKSLGTVRMGVDRSDQRHPPGLGIPTGLAAVDDFNAGHPNKPTAPAPASKAGESSPPKPPFAAPEAPAVRTIPPLVGQKPTTPAAPPKPGLSMTDRKDPAPGPAPSKPVMAQPADAPPEKGKTERLDGSF